MRSCRIFGLTLIASIVGLAIFSVSAQRRPIGCAALSLRQAEYYNQHPQELQLLLEVCRGPRDNLRPVTFSGGAGTVAGSWTTLTKVRGSPCKIRY